MVMKLNFLAENSPKIDSHLLAEHGLSIYIECDNLKLIFDTGNTDIYLKVEIKAPRRKQRGYFIRF